MSSAFMTLASKHEYLEKCMLDVILSANLFDLLFIEDLGKQITQRFY